MQNFITNDQNKLSDVIKQILPETESCYFLVGYFYFSGFSEIYKHLADKKIKILVGLELDKTTQGVFAEVYKLRDQNPSNKEMIDNYLNSFVEFVNSTDHFDRTADQEVLKLFVEKIKDGTLMIRKTREPTHAKIYLFEKKGGPQFAPGYLIVGSSNLTRSGLSTQNEINFFTAEAIYFNEAKKIFEKLWEDSIEIVSEKKFSEFEERVLKKTWIFTEPSPKELYVRVLYEYFSTYQVASEKLPSKITEGKFLDLRYQLDAINRALKILQDHNGVLIADVVGLGKTIVASTIAHILQLKTVVIAPPHLVPTWESFRYDFDFNAKVFSSGKLNEALEFVESSPGEKLVIIDEAHKYRNQSTQTYHTVHRICSGNKVILLTATPFNNRPSDILSMIKLFKIPAASSLGGKQLNLQSWFYDLDKRFKSAVESGDKTKLSEISNEVRQILEPIIIRRTRLDLLKIEQYRRDLESQSIRFPVIESPRALNYDLEELAELYLETIERICPENESKAKNFFKATRYKVTSYVKNIDSYKERLIEHFRSEDFEQAQQNIAQMIRRLLAHRFESSIYAFKMTLERIIESTKFMIKWYDRGYVPLYKRGEIVDPDEIFESDEVTDEQLLDEPAEDVLEKLEQKGYFFIKSDELRKKFRDDLEEDVQVLEEIHKKWFGGSHIEDKKLKAFRDVLSRLYSEKPDRKIVVFSMFADTIDYLYENLKDSFKTIKFTGSDSTKEKIKLIEREFSLAQPVSNNYQLLLATDALSEGVSLNRADVIINYDIPYNPTRVIQRVGRLNRIGTKAQERIYIYNYFPTALGEEETLVKRISTAKIHMFNFILGTDTKILTDEEKINSYFAQDLKDEELSWDVEYLNDLNGVKTSDEKTYKRAINLPARVRVKIKDAGRNGALIFARKNNLLNFVLVDSDFTKIISPKEGLEMFKKYSESSYSRTDEKLESYLAWFKANLKIDDLKLSQKEKKLCDYIDFLKNEYDLQDEYLDRLREAVVHSAISNYAMKEMLKILKAAAEGREEITESLQKLRSLVPEAYLDKLISSIDEHKREIEDAQIIIIEQLSKD